MVIQFYWHIFLVWFGIKEKGCHHNVCMHFSLLSMFVMWLLLCYFVQWWISLYVLAFFNHNSSVTWMDTFDQNASHYNCSKQIEASYVLNLVMLGSVVFERHWLWVMLLLVLSAVPYVSHAQDSPTADTPLQLVK